MNEIEKDFLYKMYVEINGVDTYCEVGGYWNYQIEDNHYYLEIRRIYDIYNNVCVKNKVSISELLEIEKYPTIEMIKFLERKIESYNLRPIRGQV